MSFNRLLSITYNGVTIGQGSTLGEPTAGWSLMRSPEAGVLKMRFVVADSGGATALANMAAIEAAFSVRRKRVTISYSGSSVNDVDPTIATLTGYEAFPEIRHGDDVPGPHGLYAETYELTVRFRIPADNHGRRDEHPAIERTLAARRKVRFDGVWTAVAGSGALEQFEDAAVGFEPHATTFLAFYDNTAQWAEAVHDVTLNDTDTELHYHSEFWEHSYGQVNEERTVSADLHNLRRVLVSGTWIDPAGVKSASPLAALASFNDATHGFYAQIKAWLTATYPGSGFAPYALSPRVNAINGTVDYSAELWECEEIGGANTGRRFSRVTVDQSPSGRLSVTTSGVYMQTLDGSGTPIPALSNYRDGTNGALAYATDVQTAINTAYGGGITWDGMLLTRYDYNEQVGIVEWTFQFKQITQNQSLAAGRDPEVVDDNWDLVATTEGPGDSPVVLGGQSINAVSGTPVKRRVIMEATYRAWIKLDVDPMTKWTSGLRSYVVEQLLLKLRSAGGTGSLMRDVPEVDPVNNTLTAKITMETYTATYLELSIEENVSRDNGLIFTPILSGNDDDYEEQQGPTMGTKVRTTRLLSTQFGTIFAFASPDTISGYRRLRWSVGQKTIVEGIEPYQTTIYAAELVEEFLAVNASAGSSSANRQATFSGLGSNTQNNTVNVGETGVGADGGGSLPGGKSQPYGFLGDSSQPSGDSGGGNVPANNAQTSTTGFGGANLGSVDQ